MLATLLLEKPPVPTKGRAIRFGMSELDINFTTGSMAERIVSILGAMDEPLTAKQIATGISSSSSRVATTLKTLIAAGKVSQIKIDGCTAEYTLIQESCNVLHGQLVQQNW